MDAENFADRLERFLTPELSKEQKGEKESRGEYEFIPLGFERFKKQIQIVDGLLVGSTSREKLKFVDVGSGIGTKLLIARALLGRVSGCGFEITGIERTHEYIEVARKLLHSQYEREQVRLLEMDALEMDYGSFDVIYFYCPIHNRTKEQELEERIIRTCKPGAYILGNHKESDIWGEKDAPVRHIWEHTVYQKRTPKEMRKLKRELKAKGE